MSTVSVAGEAFKFLYDWAVMVLPTTTIVLAHQNAPSPKLPYIAIQFPGVSQHGQSALGMQDDGSAERISQFDCETIVWQVGGDGDLLRQLRSSIELKDIQEFFQSRFVALRGQPVTHNEPRLEQSNFVREYRMELNFGMALANYDQGIITGFEAVGTIETRTITVEVAP